MIQIPDHPIGERFCRKCALFLPLADFFKGKKRRYECKAHSRGRPRRKALPKREGRLQVARSHGGLDTPKTSPQRNKAVAQVWHAAYTDCRSSFGQATVGVSQAELRDLFEALGAEPSTAFRLVPIDPCRALATGNARLVQREVRIGALRAWSDVNRRCSKGSNARDSFMAAINEEEDVTAAAAAEVEVSAGQGQPGGLVRAEDSSEQQRGEVVGYEEEEQVKKGEGTDDEGHDDDDDDDAQHQAVRLKIE